MSPEVARLGHVALETPDLDASLEFFRDAAGLEITERTGDTVYLRAVDEWDHHSMSLTEAEEPGIDHVGWQTAEPEHVGEYAEQFETQGLDVTWVDDDAEPGQGEAIRFDVPEGHRFELYGEMEKPDPPAERDSKLKNRVYDPSGDNPIAPNRIDHLQIWDPDGLGCAEWLQENLGFQVQEFWDDADGERWGTFLSACEVKIDLAVVQSTTETDDPAVHHVAYDVTSANDLFAAHDVMNELGFPTDGIGQHAISRGEFCYTRDPVSGHRIEFNTGSYLTLDPHWEPVAWQEGDLKDRQWIGAIESTERVRY
ncbi:VOC family protein [Haloarcula sp. 1CSR25-25]|uniref:VOC family protein n=1 Tax=Haloarcula sp. 1CSR25-25 TaxID=2862545 RepID=UPI00289528CD|nr:VOC family protein [Haloarcula sp. 1CSR25-25]MDT3437156.1 VOC family protein [Haloarcula sp. 1CSR25-25]